MSYVQFIQMSPGDIVDLIDKKLEERLKPFHNDLGRQKIEEELLTIEQTSKFLKIDQSTLWRWTKKGKVKAYSIAGKRYYKRSEIMESLKPVIK